MKNRDNTLGSRGQIALAGNSVCLSRERTPGLVVTKR